MTSVEFNRSVLRDQAARNLIIRELRSNVMVLAGAGAGKTYALIERMVAAIRSGTARVDRVAAITFTRKAAGEMRGRFYLRLRKELENTVTEDETARLRAAIADVDQCFIGTIHSFCGRMLRERPLDAGLAPGFTELEERDEMVLRREAWDRFVQSAYLADDRRLQEMDEHGITAEDLYPFFGRRCVDADLPLKTTTTQKPDLLALVPQVEVFISQAEAHLPSSPSNPDKLMTALRRARHFIDNHGIETDRDAAILLTMFEGSLSVTLKRWADPKAAKKIASDSVPAFQSTVVEPALRRWRECAYRVVTDFVNDAVSTYARARHREGHVTFQDLLVRTADMFRENSSVRAYFQRRFETLFVDEFQDTDPVQAHILFFLTGTDLDETDWRNLIPRPGSLFLVGDDKQSIYRFRRADVEIFQLVAERIEATGGHVVHLNTSFRSLGNLCKWISDSFAPIFSVEGEPYQAPFKPLFDYRDAGIDPYCVRKILIPKVKGNRRSGIAAHEADRIVGFISAALKGATSYGGLTTNGSGNVRASAGDFLILTRTTAQIPVFARALEHAGIPFDVAGGGRLGGSEEVRSLVNLLETVYEPNNALRFLAYLRGPLVGLSDADLYDIRTSGGRFFMDAPLSEGLDEELRTRLERAVDQLDAARSDLTSLPPGAAVQRIVDRLGLLAFSATHPDGSGSSRAGSLLRVLSIIRNHAARGWSWGRIVEDLRELVDDPTYKVEEMTLELGRADVVRIMNVHQAKGLQAPVVFLADSYDTSHTKKPISHVCRTGRETYLSMIVTKDKGEYGHEVVAQPEEWEQDFAEEQRFVVAEEVRLLYVAATRARDLLIVSAYPEKPEAGPWSPLYRFLSEVPELPVFQPSTVTFGADEDLTFSTVRRGATLRISRSLEATHAVRTISGISAEDEFLPSVRQGRGRDYGVVIHRLFEEAVSGRLPSDVEKYIGLLIRDAGLKDDLVADALGAWQRFRTSALWQDVKKSKRVFTEVPLGGSVCDEEPISAVRGVIDLVYEYHDTWRIIDYKTDLATSADDLEHLRRKYTPQIMDYGRYWTQVTGEPVECGFWFVHGPARDEQLTLF